MQHLLPVIQGVDRFENVGDSEAQVPASRTLHESKLRDTGFEWAPAYGAEQQGGNCQQRVKQFAPLEEPCCGCGGEFVPTCLDGPSTMQVCFVALPQEFEDCVEHLQGTGKHRKEVWV